MQGSKPVECEVLNVIQAAGIWPDCDDKTQLLQAIQKLIPSAVSQRQYFTEDGSFVVPEGVTKLRVTVAGAGGGGGLNGYRVSEQSEDGEASSVTYNQEVVIAEGGKGGWSAKTTAISAPHGCAANGDVNFVGQGSPGGNVTTSQDGLTGGAGGNGGLAVKEFDVLPGETLQIVVGAGGTSTADPAPDYSGNYGVDGYVIIEWV